MTGKYPTGSLLRLDRPPRRISREDAERLAVTEADRVLCDQLHCPDHFNALTAPLGRHTLNGTHARMLARTADLRLRGLTPGGQDGAPIDVQLRALGVKLHLHPIDQDLVGVSVRRPYGICLIANASANALALEATWLQLLVQVMFFQPDPGHLAAWRLANCTGSELSRRRLTVATAESLHALRVAASPGAPLPSAHDNCVHAVPAVRT